MRFPDKIISSCIWVALPVDWVILHWYACGADGRSFGVRSRDYQIDFLIHGAPLRAGELRYYFLLFLTSSSSKRPLGVWSDLYVRCMYYAAQYTLYVKLLAVTWNYTYRKLEIACNLNLGRWVWTSSRKRPLCGSILVSNHLPQTTTKSSLFGWSLTRGLTVFIFLLLSPGTCLLPPALKCNCISFSEWLVRDLAWGRNNKATHELHGLVNH